MSRLLDRLHEVNVRYFGTRNPILDEVFTLQPLSGTRLVQYGPDGSLRGRVTKLPSGTLVIEENVRV